MNNLIFKEFDIFNFLSMMENHYVGFNKHRQDNTPHTQEKCRLKKKMLQYVKNPTEDCDLTTKLLVSMYILYCENKNLKLAVNHNLGLTNVRATPSTLDLKTNEIKSFEIETKDTPTVVKTEVEVIPPTKEYLEKYEFLLMYNDIEHILTLKLTEQKTLKKKRLTYKRERMLIQNINQHLNLQHKL